MNFSINKPIAIIDSGLGGVSVLRQLINKFSGGNYIYYADNLYMPYGNKNKQLISNRLDYIIKLLQTKYNAKVVIIACNTASSSIDINKYKNVYIMQFNKNFTYYATNLTKQNLKDIEVIADKTLPNLVEKNIINKTAIEKIVKRHIKQHKLYEKSEIVLGCTHFELVFEYFKKYLKHTNVINNSEFIVKQLEESKFNYTNICLLMSKKSKDFEDKFYKLLNWPFPFC